MFKKTYAVANASNGINGGGGESQFIYDALDLGLGILGLGGNNGNNEPSAYLSYLLLMRI